MSDSHPGIDEIFQKALGKTPEERKEYLDEVCAGNPELATERSSDCLMLIRRPERFMEIPAQLDPTISRRPYPRSPSGRAQ